jgi:hypothetical protein
MFFYFKTKWFLFYSEQQSMPYCLTTRSTSRCESWINRYHALCKIFVVASQKAMLFLHRTKSSMRLYRMFQTSVHVQSSSLNRTFQTSPSTSFCNFVNKIQNYETISKNCSMSLRKRHCKIRSLNFSKSTWETTKIF